MWAGAFSAALCRGLIEAQVFQQRFEREEPQFSAALCRGLIEATPAIGRTAMRSTGFPRLYAAASLKLMDGKRQMEHAVVVFRGFMPRPH